MKRISFLVNLWVAAASHPAGAIDEAGGAFQFALIGDAPYGVPAGEPAPNFDRLVAEINADPDLRWVLHVGDVMGESTGCPESLYRDRLERLNALDMPVVVTPGDNDWTDCHRAGGGGWDPLERLRVMRQVFYEEPVRSIGGDPMPLTSQAEASAFEDFPENVRWTRGGVVFATVHLVGSNNGANDFQGRDEDDDAEVARRSEAGIAWLNRAFDRAEDTGAAGVFVMIHANPVRGHAREPGELSEAYLPFLRTLERRTREFEGPVVLAHGSSHYFRVDKPYLPRGEGSNGEPEASRLDNFTRVESFGYPLIHWVRVTVDPDDPEVFSFEQEIVAGN